MASWYEQRWETLSHALEQASDVQEIERLCREEIAAWRARGLAANSLRKPLTFMRNALKEVPLTDLTRWVNPRTRVQEHRALNYLTFSDEEWRLMDKPSDDRFRQRMEQVQLLDTPDAIVVRAEDLLTRSRLWEDLVVGLAVVTGRRLSELLKTGQFYAEQPYTVLFAGQLKQRAEELKPYEIPTLCRADLVIAALSRLRSLLDCSKLDVHQLAERYSPAASEAAQRHFTGLVPVRPGSRKKLYTHLERSVYGAIAVFYFCPQTTVDLHFLAKILGHEWVERVGDDAKADYAATLHYFDYRIGDGTGHVDKRQGIKLGEPGVTILKAFQPTPQQAQEKQTMIDNNPLTTEKATKSGISRPHVPLQTMMVIKQIEQEVGVRDFDAVLQILVKEHYLYQQLQIPAQQEWRGLFEELQQREVKDPVVYVRDLLEKEQHFTAGLERRYAGVNYAELSLEQLANTKTPEALIERTRRAIAAIMRYNAANEPVKRWYINQSSINALVGGRKTAIGEYLDAHREEIEAHHTAYEILPTFNRKPASIKEQVPL